jgi:hypothetical protein
MLLKLNSFLKNLEIENHSCISTLAYIPDMLMKICCNPFITHHMATGIKPLVILYWLEQEQQDHLP